MPVLRDIDWLQYSIDRDLRRKLERLEAVFSKAPTVDGEGIEYERTCIVAMSARVGSTALVGSLQNAGLSRHPIREIFNNRGYTAHFVDQLGAGSMCDYLNRYATLCGHDRLPFKIGWWDMAPLIELVRGDLETWFPNATWVYLQRRDTVAQAYSLWKAANHGIWHVHDGEDYRCPVAGRIPLHEIRELQSLIRTENRGWESFFAARGIEPARIFYEDFAANPRTATARAYREFTGTTLEGDVTCPLVKSSDEEDLSNVEGLRRRLAA